MAFMGTGELSQDCGFVTCCVLRVCDGLHDAWEDVIGSLFVRVPVMQMGFGGHLLFALVFIHYTNG